jgi:hypothetical protein
MATQSMPRTNTLATKLATTLALLLLASAEALAGGLSLYEIGRQMSGWRARDGPRAPRTLPCC